MFFTLHFKLELLSQDEVELTSTLLILASVPYLVETISPVDTHQAHHRQEDTYTHTSKVSKKWQAEVEALNIEASTMYKNYQNEVVFLSQEQKKAKQEAIMNKEKEASELKKKYFGPEGELFKKREALMGPIQEEIYNAVKEVSDLRGYSLVLDRASNSGIIFGSPKIDISNEVLKKLGYSAN